MPESVGFVSTNAKRNVSRVNIIAIENGLGRNCLKTRSNRDANDISGSSMIELQYTSQGEKNNGQIKQNVFATGSI